MGALNAILGLVPGATATAPTSGAGSAAATTTDGKFGNSMTSALDGLNATQANADDLAVKAATGDLTDVHNYTIAATEANLATEFTVQMRNRVVETFNEIMRMQI